MRFLLLLMAFILAALAPADAAHPPTHAAAAPRADQPRPLGHFEDWTAATHLEGGHTVCYAFTRVRSSSLKIPGRGEVVLTVTERPTGRDMVAISAGYPYAAGAVVRVQIERASFEFYTAQRSAFARDGHAVVVAMRHRRDLVAHGPAPHAGQVGDNFSLRGFDAAYAAIVKACPAK